MMKTPFLLLSGLLTGMLVATAAQGAVALDDNPRAQQREAALIGAFEPAVLQPVQPAPEPGPKPPVSGPVADTTKVTFSFPLYQMTAPLQPLVPAVAIQSDEYWQPVSGAALNRGVKLAITQPGALVLISRADETAPALHMEKLRFTAPDGKALQPQQLVSEEKLQTAGIFMRSAAVKLAAAMAPGAVLLKTGQALPAKAGYVIHVKEKGSPLTLKLAAARQSFREDERVAVTTVLQNGKQPLAGLNRIKGRLLAPDGRQVELPLQRHGNQLTFDPAWLQQILPPVAGLYELLVDATGETNGMMVRRTAKLALALAPATARLDGAPQMVAGKVPQASLKVQISQPGRYEVRAVLMGRDASGQLRPIMETQQAQYLDVGEHHLKVPFDAAILARSGLRGPYQLKRLALLDQSRMSLQQAIEL